MGVGLFKGFRSGLTAVQLAAAFAALACLGAAPWDLPDTTGVAKVRLGGDLNETRIVVELGRSARGKLMADGSNGRLVLALPGVGVAGDLSGEGRGLVRDWRVDRVAGAATVEVALQRPARVVRRFVLPPTEGIPNYRYVIDLAGLGPPLAPPPAPARTAAAPRMIQVADRAPVHARKVIVIDAGHGGKDPGALGAHSREKDLTLAAAKALKRRLEREGRYKVVLTRSSDVFVPLEERVRIARKADADLFISLHANSGPDPDLRGAAVYTLSDKGSDRVARNVMNRDDWFINVSMPSRDQSVNRILLDLTQRETRNQSSAFAETLVDHVGEASTLLQHSHRDAGYVVLLAPDVPAVLLEMGFITNPKDEAELRDTRDRERLMDAVGDAIDDYFSTKQLYASR